jgi:FlaA1/EpsC-like NDP-sugar epimerase
MVPLKNFFENKKVLVTGCCGTVGSELVKQLLLDFQVNELIGLDNNESELFFLSNLYSNYPHASFSLADVRDREKLSRKMSGIDIVFHTAAFKHVVLCERSPYEAVQTNIMGVQNIISAAIENGVACSIFTSSDKAVNPTSVMGTSKLMGERLMTAANSNHRAEGSIFASTRFGNVLGSRGSVIPIFREQIRKGGPVTLTDPLMTRFIMSIQEAIQLVIESAYLAQGGEVLITKMPVIRIKDLADVMIRELSPIYGHRPENIRIKIIGNKPGEKMYEELMSNEETRRAWELDRYYVVFPAFRNLYRKIDYHYDGLKSKEVDNEYNSNNEMSLSQQELSDFLYRNQLLENNFSQQPNFEGLPGVNHAVEEILKNKSTTILPLR